MGISKASSWRWRSTALRIASRMAGGACGVCARKKPAGAHRACDHGLKHSVRIVQTPLLRHSRNLAVREADAAKRPRAFAGITEPEERRAGRAGNSPNGVGVDGGNE